MFVRKAKLQKQVVPELNIFVDHRVADIGIEKAGTTRQESIRARM